MDGEQPGQLLEKLLKADSEAEVIAILKEDGYWDDA